MCLKPPSRRAHRRFFAEGAERKYERVQLSETMESVFSLMDVKMSKRLKNKMIR